MRIFHAKKDKLASIEQYLKKMSSSGGIKSVATKNWEFHELN
jgi:hypothetical protein